VLQQGSADFTLAFRLLGAAQDADGPGEAGLRGLFAAADALAAWLPRWRARIARDPACVTERATAMRRANPLFIPRNHRIEQAIVAAVEASDFTPFDTLTNVLARPYDEQPEHAGHAAPARPAERVCRTFCGT
jgi:uncharacterized protein YdiU (UPF0061 family)